MYFWSKVRFKPHQLQVLFCVLLIGRSVEGHGRLLRPPSRSSIWRHPAYSHLGPKINYNDNELFCGGVHQATNPGDNCGVCGDPLRDPIPRDNEYLGTYYRGISDTYKSGQAMLVEAEITASHKGFMEYRLCLDANTEDQSCFNEHLLELFYYEGSKVPVSGPGIYLSIIKLPKNVTCDHCVLQWNYRAGNNWGYCEDGRGALGCGPQETFRGCADIRIT